MSIFDRDFEKAIKSTDAARLRGKIGAEKANFFIQEIHNKLYMPKNIRKCGFDIKEKGLFNEY